MSRDTGERDAELLTPYVDGVGELSADERRRVAAELARDPRARADEAVLRSLLDQLRALPPEGTEPDWAAMERSIHDAVGRDIPRPWWRSWKWLAPTTTLATALVVLLVIWARPRAIVPAPDVNRVVVSASPVTGEEIVPLWLDGSEVDVDLSASDMLGDPETGDDEPAPAQTPGDDATDAGFALLPSTDLAWVDGLDDAALARAERWLAGAGVAPSRSPGAEDPDSPGSMNRAGGQASQEIKERKKS